MAAAVAGTADSTLESRVARLESDVAHIRSDITDMKRDIREMRNEMKRDIREIRNDMSAIDKRIADLDRKSVHGLTSNRVWMLLQSAALLAVMARAFKWL